jgi:membrane associated rhomboid family serine protease
VSQPDLFVVCKNCGSEVSPYVTECPYCGQRVRKRAPKLERDGQDEAPRPKQRRRPRLARLRPEEIEGIAPDTRPVMTIALIAASLVITLVLAASDSIFLDEVGGLVPGAQDEPWRYVTTAFVHDSLAYQFVALTVVGIFGSLLERRFGWFVVLLLFVGCGAAGAAAAAAVDLAPPFDDDPFYLVLGANGAALGMLAAWYVDDRRAARRGEDRENDLLGVYVLAALLALLPLAVTEASFVAGFAGAAAGAVLGLALAAFARR